MLESFLLLMTVTHCYSKLCDSWSESPRWPQNVSAHSGAGPPSPSDCSCWSRRSGGEVSHHSPSTPCSVPAFDVQQADTTRHHCRFLNHVNFQVTRVPGQHPLRLSYVFIYHFLKNASSVLTWSHQPWISLLFEGWTRCQRIQMRRQNEKWSTLTRYGSPSVHGMVLPIDWSFAWRRVVATPPNVAFVGRWWYGSWFLVRLPPLKPRALLPLNHQKS